MMRFAKKANPPRASRGGRKGPNDHEGHRELRGSQVRRAETRESTGIKSSYRTTELIVYVLAVLGVLIAALFVDGGADGFNTADAWRYVTYLTVGYIISRGLAKAGSREPYQG